MILSNRFILCSTFLLHSVFPSIRSFPTNRLIAAGTQSLRASASASVLPISIQHWFSSRTDWFDFLPVQGTLKSLLQFYSLKAPIHWHSAFFMVQLSHPYMTTGKTRDLSLWMFIGKVMSLILNILSSFVISFLSRSKPLWISWLQSLSAVTLEPKKIKSITVSIFAPSICHEVMGPDAMIFVSWMLSCKPAFSLSFHFQMVKNLPAVQETWVWSLSWEDILDKGTAAIPVFWPGEFHGLYSPRGRKSWTWLSYFHFHLNQEAL